MAWKQMENISNIKDLEREDVEKDLIFCGLAIYDCPLKKDTKQNIDKLLNANFKV